MSLTDHERRVWETLEAELAESDRELARTLSGTAHQPRRVRPVAGTSSMSVAGVAAMLVVWVLTVATLTASVAVGVEPAIVVGVSVMELIAFNAVIAVVLHGRKRRRDRIARSYPRQE